VTYDELAVQVIALEKRLSRIADEREKYRHERDEYRKLYELASMELERLRRHVFGQKAERVDAAQMHHALDKVLQALGTLPQGPEPPSSLPNPASEDPTEPQGETLPPPPAPPALPAPPTGGKPKTKARKVTPHGRQTLPEHLPVERIELLPPEAMGEAAASLVRIGEEVSERLEWRPASLVRVQIVRPKFAFKGAPDKGILIAPAAEEPMARCMAGPGLLAHLLVSKYGDHLPLHRMEKIFARQGLALARSTLCGWVAACAELLRYIVEAMLKEALHSPWIAIDATGVLVQAKEKCRKGHFWVLVAGDDHVLFRYTPRHTQDGPKSFLQGYKGYVLADAHSVYELLYRTEEVLEVGCWAHTRRRFFKALSSDKEQALVALGFISRLYAIDAELKQKPLPPDARTAERQRLATPVLDAFRAWLDSEKPRVLPKSPLGEAIGYACNQWTALTRFLEDGRLRLDNNGAERELRREAVGRKNWLFAGSDEGAAWNAVTVSLIASCEMHGVEPWAYLRDVLQLVLDWPRDRLLELSPKSWKQTREHSDARQRLASSVWQRAEQAMPP
jgi:transposase